MSVVYGSVAQAAELMPQTTSATRKNESRGWSRVRSGTLTSRLRVTVTTHAARSTSPSGLLSGAPDRAGMRSKNESSVNMTMPIVRFSIVTTTSARPPTRSTQYFGSYVAV